jgi:cation transport regulator ChaC
MAFRFPSLHEPTILSYLTRREGQGFRLHELQIRLDDQSLVTAFVAIYEGPSVIEAKEIEDLAAMVVSASGAKGPCASYVVGVAKALSEIGIEDSAVAELESAVKRHPSFRDMGVP